MRIPDDHKCVFHYISRLGLAARLRPFVHKNVDGYFHLRGRRVRIRDWMDLTDPASSPYGALSEHFLHSPPDDILNNVAMQATSFIQHPGHETSLLEGKLGEGLLRKYEGMTLWQYLGGLDKSGSLTALLHALPTAEPPFSDSEWEYVGRATGKLWEEQISFLAQLLDEVSFMNPLKWEIEGGIEVLVDRFAAALEGYFHLESTVTHVDCGDDGVRVRIHEGNGSKSFDYAICCAPASATVQIAFDPPLSPRKYEALTNLTYGAASKTLVHCKERFWEQSPDRIFGGASYTDLPIQQCWYPSDNAIPVEEADEEEELGENELGGVVGPTAFGRGDLLAGELVVAPQVWQARDPEASRGPGVFIGSYLWGTNAHRFASMSPSQRDDLVLGSLEQIHPTLRQYVEDQAEDIVHHAWDAEINPGGGGYAMFAPGERERYQTALWQPHPDGNPRVFFAGEHLAILHAWIQGAMTTALGAVIEVLQS